MSVSHRPITSPCRQRVRGFRRGIGDKASYLLTTTGRRSGQERTTPVIFLESEGERFLVSPYGAVGWVHNPRVLNRVKFRRGNTGEVATAEELGRDEAGPVLKTYVRRAPVAAPFFDARPPTRSRGSWPGRGCIRCSGSARPRLGTEDAPGGRLPVRSGGRFARGTG